MGRDKPCMAWGFGDGLRIRGGVVRGRVRGRFNDDETVEADNGCIKKKAVSVQVE